MCIIKISMVRNGVNTEGPLWKELPKIKNLNI